MIWLLLICKAILTIWLLTRALPFLGTFLAVHTLVDVLNKFQKSYYVAMVSLVIVPHTLIACLAELRGLKYLRYVNVVSFILLSLAVTKYNYPLTDVVDYFLLYSNVVLISTTKPINFKNKEDLLLSAAMLLQIAEIIVFKLNLDYIVINVLNGIYYLIVALFLLQINTPILDDFVSARLEKLKIFSVEEEQSNIKKAA